MRKTVRLRIEGRVQGVGFRAWLAAAARRLGLDGWVANRRDGGVEAVASGPAAQIDVLVAECHEGPPAARVDMVKCFDELDAPPPGFEVGATR